MFLSMIVRDDMYLMYDVVYNCFGEIKLIGCWFAAGKINSRRFDNSQRELTANSHEPTNSPRPEVVDGN
jgi:hypothetical protein